MSDESNIAETRLRDLARSGKLTSAQLSEDGATLLMDGSTTLPANVVLTVSHGDKTCSYSAASIFLQLLDPNQGLLAYRNACKKHSVKDPIKALDKPVILGSFLGVSTGLASEAAAPNADASAVAASKETDKAALKQPSEKSRSDRQKKKDRKKSSHHKEHHSASKRSRDHRGSQTSSKKAKKTPKGLVTNEQLFDNLNVVVDKRQTRLRQATGRNHTRTLHQRIRGHTGTSQAAQRQDKSHSFKGITRRKLGIHSPGRQSSKRLISCSTNLPRSHESNP